MQPRLSRISNERGQTLPLVVAFMFVIMIVCGMVLDVGNAYRVKTALQASADAAAAAGADNLPNTASADAAAHQYSSAAGGINPVRGASNVQLTSVENCVTSAKFCNPANTVQVTESADVPTFFLKVVGIDSISETVHSQACSPCGGKPLDIMIVLDRTGSMGDPSNAGGTKLDSAVAGVKAFLGTMDTGLDNIGLAVLPPASSPSTACNRVNANNPYSDPTPAYTVVPLSNTYGTMNGQNITLNQNSPLLQTINCVQPGGSTAYALALEAANAELTKDGRPGVQKVIIFLSDGAANDGPSYMSASSPYNTQPCTTAINDATGFKNNKVLMYSIGYDIGGDNNTYCLNANGRNESPLTLASSAMSQIASPGNYYAQPTPDSLTNIFLAISADLSAGTSRING